MAVLAGNRHNIKLLNSCSDVRSEYGVFIFPPDLGKNRLLLDILNAFDDRCVEGVCYPMHQCLLSA